MRRRATLAVMLSFGVVLWHHAIDTFVRGEGLSFTGHAQNILLATMLGIPVVFAAIWAAERFVGQRASRATWRDHAAFAAVTSVIFAGLMVPLSIVQMNVQEILGGSMSGQHHTEMAGAGLAGLAEHGVQYALIAQPVVFLLTLLTVGFMVSPPLGTKQQRRKFRVATIAAATALITTAPIDGVTALAEDTPQNTSETGGVVPQAIAGCNSAPQKTWNVSAINVDMVLDRWGDHNPYAYMYALNSQIAAIRAFEQQTNGIDAAGKMVGNPSRQVSTGLKDDPIQPLTIRANLGDCVVINLTNRLTAPPRGGPGPNGAGALRNGQVIPGFPPPAPADGLITQPGGIPSVSIDAMGVAYRVAEGGNSVGNNPDRMVAPGQTKQYKFFLDPLMGEGGKVFHSGGDSQQLTAHGLFGAIVAEPAGSRIFDPRTGAERTNDRNWTSWDAMISPAGQPAFREFVIMYHDVGDENFNVRMSRRADDPAQVNDVNGNLVTAPGNDPRNGNNGVDPLGWPQQMIDSTPSSLNPDNSGLLNYRPGGKAINYRSEPFQRRLDELQRIFPGFYQGADAAARAVLADQQKDKKALGYSSYTYGDPATPIPMSYLNEPTKTRLMHPGSEQLHVHHLHGGGDRWRANPNADDPNAMFGGVNKNPNNNALSIRLDSQTVGPDEAYDLEHECGAGGCQAAAGDFLFHCHIAQHYIAGMFSFWRVFDTNQAGLAPLPNASRPAGSVTSDQLIGRTFEGKTVVADNVVPTATQIRLRDWVEPRIPPQGARNTKPDGSVDTDDATTWDWIREGNVYFGEPEAALSWPNYTRNPGTRPDTREAIRWNPNNGRYAWPLFEPHLGMRPPFSPNGHSGAPWAGEQVAPGRPDGMCPRAPRPLGNAQGLPTNIFNVVAINPQGGLRNTKQEVDREGRIFTIAEKKNTINADNAEPFTIRSNVGDCVALTLTSELNPNSVPLPGNPIAEFETGQKKVNMHTHFVQFDPQASDGVITGMSYEQSVGNYKLEGTNHAGRTVQANVPAGATSVTLSDVGGLKSRAFIAIGQGTENIEIRQIASISGSTVNLTAALGRAHPAGEFAGVEFVQYRWYTDVDSGTIFFHDHVDGITSWAKGLAAAHIVEPAGSRYIDPTTGADLRQGTQAIIRTTGRVGVDHAGGDFREYMLFLSNGRRGRPQAQTGVPLGNDLFDFGSACEESAINLRAEPFAERSAGPLQRLEWNGGFCGNRGVDDREEDPAARPPRTPVAGTWSNETFNTVDPYVFSSARYGDPATPLLRSYPGDPVVIRTLGLNERVEALRMQGHRFRRERFNTSGELMDAATTGISERFDYILDGGAGGPGKVPGDYLYYSTRNFALASGGWGIFRVFGDKQGDEAGETPLLELTNRPAPTAPGFPRIAPNSGNPRPPTTADDNINPCTAGAPVRRYDISIFNLALPTGPNVDPDPDNDPATNTAGQPGGPGDNIDRSGVIYSMTRDVASIKQDPASARPLVLRANTGECVQVTLRNQIDDAGRKTLFPQDTADRGRDYGGDTGGTRASFELAKLRGNVQQSGGGAVGLNPDTTVARGQSRTYTFMADKELGTSIFQNLASPASVIHGAYGLFITEPVGAQWFHSVGGARMDNVLDANGNTTQTDVEAIIRSNMGTNNFREFALTMSTTDQGSGRSVVPYWDNVAGTGESSENSENPGRAGGTGFYDANNPITLDRIQPGFSNLNYHTANIAVREARNGLNFGAAFRNTGGNTDPTTGVFRAFAEDRTVLRVGIPASNQFHTFHVGGHAFPWEPNMWDDRGDFRSQLLTARAMSSGETQEVELVGGAGTRLGATGDFMFGDGRMPFQRAGLWGILRVLPAGSAGPGGPAPL